MKRTNMKYMEQPLRESRIVWKTNYTGHKIEFTLSIFVAILLWLELFEAKANCILVEICAPTAQFKGFEKVPSHQQESGLVRIVCVFFPLFVCCFCCCIKFPSNLRAHFNTSIRAIKKERTKGNKEFQPRSTVRWTVTKAVSLNQYQQHTLV